MGSQGSKDTVKAYEKASHRVERWGVGLIICLGKRTPYVVSSITPVSDPHSLHLMITTNTTSDNSDVTFTFTKMFTEDLLPIDKDGKVISTTPVNGKYIYDITMVPAPALKLGGVNTRVIVDSIVGNTIATVASGGAVDSSEEEGEVLNKLAKNDNLDFTDFESAIFTINGNNNIANNTILEDTILNDELEIPTTVNFTQPTKELSGAYEDNIADCDLFL